MTRVRGASQRRAAALISAIAILLIMAAFAAMFLDVHSTHVSSTELAVHRLRAEAAALAATQLTLWSVQRDPNLQSALARVIQQGDTSFDTTPLIRVDGNLTGVAFRVELWPGPDTARVRAVGTSGSVEFERWTQMPIVLR